MLGAKMGLSRDGATEPPSPERTGQWALHPLHKHSPTRCIQANTPNQKQEVGPCRTAFQASLLYFGHGRCVAPRRGEERKYSAAPSASWQVSLRTVASLLTQSVSAERHLKLPVFDSLRTLGPPCLDGRPLTHFGSCGARLTADRLLIVSRGEAFSQTRLASICRVVTDPFCLSFVTQRADIETEGVNAPTIVRRC